MLKTEVAFYIGTGNYLLIDTALYLEFNRWTFIRNRPVDHAICIMIMTAGGK